MIPPSFCRTQLNDRGNDFPFHDPTTDSVDCNVATTSACVQLAKGTKLNAHQVRVMGGDLHGPTGTAMSARVLGAQGLVPGTDFVRFKKVDVQRVRDLLGAGWFVVVYVNYGVINDNLGGAFSGAKTYRGPHAVGLAGWRRLNGKRVTWDYDPTFDGRKPGYPFGRQLAPFWLIRQAMAIFNKGENLASGYAVKGA